MKYDMPKMEVEHFKIRIKSHLHILKRMCKKSKGFLWGLEPSSPFNDVFRLEVPYYFIATLSPTKGYFILTCPESSTEKLLDWLNNVFKCEKCLKTSQTPDSEKES